MASSPYHLFINPTAGRGRAAKRLATIESLFAEAGVDLIVHHSESEQDIEARVRDHIRDVGSDVIVAGGDGSVHEAVNGAMQAGKPAAIGVIPSGTGNDFAKAADIPLDWEAATRLLIDRLVANATPRSIDIGRMNERYFINSAGVGFDAKVTAMARSLRWPLGDVVYLVTVFRALVDGVATPAMTISTKGSAKDETDTMLWNGPLTLANASNGAWLGGMFQIAPMARIDDGRFELIVAAPVSRWRIARLLPKLMQGEHLGEPEVMHVSTTSLRIESAEPVPAHLDGEVIPPCQAFDIEVVAGAIRLL